MSKRNVFIILHIPKTGGSTLINHLLDAEIQDNYDCFFLNPRGRKLFYGNLPMLENFVKDGRFQNSGNDVIIIGHHVDEGIINYFENFDVHLMTNLREPLDRMVSHFNMIKLRGNFNKDFNVFIKTRNNFICKFIIKQFPSLVDDCLASLYIQALNVLKKFESVYYLEQPDDCFVHLLARLGISFDSSKIDKRREDGYKNFAAEGELNINALNYLGSDNSLYNAVIKGHNKSKWERQVIRSPHYWYLDICSNFFTVTKESNRSIIIQNLPTGFLQQLLEAHLQEPSLDINLIINVAMLHHNELASKEKFINILELVDYALKRNEGREINSHKLNYTCDLQVLLEILQNEQPSKLLDISDRRIQDFKFCNSSLETARAKSYFSDQRFVESESSALQAIELNAMNIDAFFLLAKVYRKLKNKRMSILAIEKCLELNPGNSKFKTFYIDIFKMNVIESV